MPADAGMEIVARPPGPLPKGELKPGKPSDLVLRAQKALAKSGIYKGRQDGRMTAATKAAVRTYQNTTGLRVTGRIDRQLVEGLENSLQVRVLLKRLDQVRIENMGAAPGRPC